MIPTVAEDISVRSRDEIGESNWVAIRFPWEGTDAWIKRLSSLIFVHLFIA